MALAPGIRLIVADDPAGLSIAIALLHDLEIHLPLTQQTTTAPRSPVLPDLEVRRTP